MAQTIERLAARALAASGKAVAANDGRFGMKLNTCDCCGDVHFHFLVDSHEVFKGHWSPDTAADVARTIQRLLLELGTRGTA